MESTMNGAIRRTTAFDDRRVCVSPCEDYDVGRLDAVIEEQCEILGLSSLVTPGCSVMIKPNLVIRRTPEEATTTHPEVVAAVIRALKRRGAGKITVAESSGGLYNKPVMSAIYQTCGMTEVCGREGAELNFDFSEVSVTCENAVTCRQFNIITPAVGADLLINVGKLKTHSMTGLSGAVKNLFGCVPGLEKPELHCQYPDPSQFQSMIVDLCTLVCPTVSFLDAVDGMEGNGPTGGSKRHIGAILGGLNPFAVDIAACRLLDIRPDSVLMLKHGMERGLSPASVGELELTGDLEPLVVRDFVKPVTHSTDFLDWVPGFLRPAAEKCEKLIAPRPVIDRAKCVGCGKCAESCPQHTIEIAPCGKAKNGAAKQAEIDGSRCIRCFCCQEMCPVRAIDIKRMAIWRM